MVKFKVQFRTLCLFTSLLVLIKAAADRHSESNFTTEQDNITINATSFFTIDVNDSVTIDYMMDESSWSFMNLTLDDVLYTDNYEQVGSQTIMNQVKLVDESSSTSQLVFVNETLSGMVNNSSFPFATYLKTQNLVKLDDSIHWPIKKEAVVEGHVILGGLMMVHEREDNMTCGKIMPQGGIQALEAMLFTLDKINEMKLLNNITIGAHILDDCDKDTYGLEMAVDFIRGKCLISTNLEHGNWIYGIFFRMIQGDFLQMFVFRSRMRKYLIQFLFNS